MWPKGACHPRSCSNGAVHLAAVQRGSGWVFGWTLMINLVLPDRLSLALPSASDNIPKADEIRTLVKDMWDTRIAKLRVSADSFVRQQEAHAKVEAQQGGTGSSGRWDSATTPPPFSLPPAGQPDPAGDPQQRCLPHPGTRPHVQATNQLAGPTGLPVSGLLAQLGHGAMSSRTFSG